MATIGSIGKLVANPEKAPEEAEKAKEEFEVRD